MLLFFIPRDLYRFVGEVIINSKGFQNIGFNPVSRSYSSHSGRFSLIDRSDVERSVYAEFEEEAKRNNLSFDASLLVVDVVKLTLSGGVLLCFLFLLE